MTRDDPIKHLFIWPAFMAVLLISISPLIYSLTTSFMSFRLVPPTPVRFVGLENYADLLANPRFWQVFGTTSLIAFTAVAIRYVIGFGLRDGQLPLSIVAVEALGPHTLLVGHVGRKPFNTQVPPTFAAAAHTFVEVGVDSSRMHLFDRQTDAIL